MFLTRYEPNRLFNQLGNDLFSIFDTPVSTGVKREYAKKFSDWAPHVDIKEEENQYVIFADMPGVDPKDMEITTEKNVLTISGKRDSIEQSETENYKRMERKRGSFTRSFTLPDMVDADKITAKGKNGVLEVVIPKTEQTQPRKITVNS